MRRTVRQVMTTEVVTVTPATPFREVAELLAREGVNGVPVVDGDRRVVGIVTAADLLAKHADPHGRSGPRPRGPDAAPAAGKGAAATAAELMSTPVATARPEEPAANLTRRVLAAGHRTVPVVNGDGRLLGVVCRLDLLRVFQRPDAAIEWEIEERVLGRSPCPPVTGLDLSVSGGVVRVRGRVERRSDTAMLRWLLEEVEGVIRVDDQVTWVIDDLAGRSAARGAAG